MNEEHIEKLIRQDYVGRPAPGVEDRLKYAFMLKSAQYKTRQNSFGGFFVWVFSMKGLGIKTAVASLLLAFVMLKPDINTGSSTAPDTSRGNQILVVDSTFFQANTGSAKDSVF